MVKILLNQSVGAIALQELVNRLFGHS